MVHWFGNAAESVEPLNLDKIHKMVDGGSADGVGSAVSASPGRDELWYSIL